MKPQTLIGIDPGASTGLAVYSRTARKLVGLYTLDFWRAYDFVIEHGRPSDFEIVIEVPTLRRLYAGRDGVEGKRVRENMATRVGGANREALLLAERFEAKGYRVRRVTPKGAKWDAATFERITKHQGATNQHVRDAARLVFGA